MRNDRTASFIRGRGSRPVSASAVTPSYSRRTLPSRISKETRIKASVAPKSGAWTRDRCDPVPEIKEQNPILRGPITEIDDHGTTFKGIAHRHDDLQFSTFQSLTDPPTLTKSDARCGFCSSKNMVWSLRCSYCGCGRVSERPRIKYAISMMLSLKPNLSNKEFASQLLKYARLDRFAIKTERQFKKDTLIRAKVGMELMSRVISKLQTKFMKFCFRGWKREVSEAQKLSTAMLKMTRIYAYRSARELKTTVFISWKMFATLQAQQNEHKIRLFHVSHDNALVARFWSRWHLFVTLQWKERCKSNANDTPRDGSSETSPEDAFKQHELLMRASITKNIQTLKTLDQSAQSQIQYIQTACATFPNIFGPLQESLGVQDLMDSFEISRIKKSLEKFRGTLMVDFQGSTQSQSNSILKTEIKSTVDRISKLPAWEVVLQWHNYIRSEVGRQSEDLKLKHIRQASVMIQYLFDMLRHLNSEVPADVTFDLNVDTTFDIYMAEKYVAAAEKFTQIPKGLLTAEKLLECDFDSIYRYLSSIFIYYDLQKSIDLVNLRHRSMCNMKEILNLWKLVRSRSCVFSPSTYHKYMEQSSDLCHRINYFIGLYTRLHEVYRIVRQVYDAHRNLVIRGAVDAFACSLNGDRSTELYALEGQKSSSRFGDFDGERIVDICNDEPEFERVKVVLEEYSSSIQQVYDTYSYGNGPISVVEFLKLVQESGITNTTDYSRQQVMDILLKSQGGYVDYQDAREVARALEELNPFQELLPLEFIEALVRVAHERFLSDCTYLHQRIRKFVKEYLHVAGTRLSSNIFLQEVRSPPVQYVFKEFRSQLGKSFSSYSQIGGHLSSKYITLGEFLQFMKDSRLIDDTSCTKETATKIIHSVRCDHLQSRVNLRKLDIIYPEFTEALAAVCYHKCPDPYIPLHRKLQGLLYIIYKDVEG